MAEAARARGYAYQVLTDHTQSLAIARGLTPERVAEQAEIIAALNARFAAEEAAGTAPAGDTGRGLPAAPRLRARGPRRRRARLRGRAAVALRRGRRVGPRRSPADTGRADQADPQRHPQPARRRHRPPVRAQDRPARRPRPRLGRGLQRGRPDRDGARDERLAAASRPRRRARPTCRRDGLSRRHRLGRPRHRRARLRPLGVSQARRAWVTPADVLNTRSRADLLAWTAAKAGRV